MCRRNALDSGIFVVVKRHKREQRRVRGRRGGTGAARSSFWIPENSKQELEENPFDGREEMPVRFYSLEKLSDYCSHDRNGNNPAPFGNPEAIPGDFVYWYWFGSDTVER